MLEGLVSSKKMPKNNSSHSDRQTLQAELKNSFHRLGIVATQESHLLEDSEPDRMSRRSWIASNFLKAKPPHRMSPRCRSRRFIDRTRPRAGKKLYARVKD